MKSRAHGKIEAIIAASNFNHAFKKVYREFEDSIFLKIKNKDPAPTTLEEFIASGCSPKKSYFFVATCFMRIELTLEHVNEMRDTIFSQLYPVIRNISTDHLELMLQCIFKAISKKILQLDLVMFEDLMNVDFRNILLSSKTFMQAVKIEKLNIESILTALPSERDKFMHEYENYMHDLINSKSSLWRLKNFKDEQYEREIENEFVLSTFRISKV